MGTIKQKLINMGYDTKERVYVYTGAIIGTVAPIIGVRYLLLPTDTKSPLEELAMWAGSLLINSIPAIIKPHIPTPAYTLSAGVVLGTVAAENSIRKRTDKTIGRRAKNLENL